VDSEKLIKPFPFIHIYKCLIENKRCSTWVEYPMFCDCNDPRSRQNQLELKRRLALAYANFRLVKFNVVSSRKNNV
jgi:hypothetical protein